MVHIHCPLHHIDLMAEPFIGNIGAPAGDFDGIPMVESPQDAGGGSGIGNSHFTDGKYPVPLPGLFVCNLDARFNGADSLQAGHGRPFGNIFRTPGDFPIQEVRHAAHVSIDAHVHDHHVRAGIIGHGIGRSPLRFHVGLCHAYSGGLGIGGNSFCINAVIAAGNDSAALRNVRHGLPCYTDKLGYHGFHFSQVPHACVQILPPECCLFHGLFIQWLNLIQCFIQ